MGGTFDVCGFDFPGNGLCVSSLDVSLGQIKLRIPMEGSSTVAISSVRGKIVVME